jgi:hypothetical protein
MNKDRNQGEGDRKSARRYDRHLRQYIDQGHVEQDADKASSFVELHGIEAERDERKAQRGPRVSVDELVAKGRGYVERIRNAVHNVRARIAKK